MSSQPEQTQTREGAEKTHWKLTLSYHGAGFHGWQVQPGLVTVQGALAQALRRITGETVLPQGAGRTDAGVHALAQVASFSLSAPIPAANLIRALNRTLSPDVRVLGAETVPPGFHARHSALRKHYEYRLFERRSAHPVVEAADRICSPFLAPFVWDCRWPLDLGALQAAAALLPGTRDFSAMAASRPESGRRGGQELQAAPNPVKTIYSAGWHRTEGLLVFAICGSGFLHHMVRNLVGTMVDVGRGSMAAEQLASILASRNRAKAGPTAPGSGLFLRAVDYPALDCPTPYVSAADIPSKYGTNPKKHAAEDALAEGDLLPLGSREPAGVQN